MSNPAETIALLEANVARNPADIASLNQLAMLKTSAGLHEEAIGHIQAALKLAPRHPLLHYNQGQILGSAERYQEELGAYQQAIALKPDFVDAYVNMGVTLRDMQRFDEAFEAFKQALRLNPDHPGARTNRAQTNLMLGNLEHGWREYEWRWQDGQQKHGIPGALWNGKASLKGKRLLVHAEQGLGDTIQFIRYLDLLSELGPTIILRVQPALAGLLAHYPGASLVVDTSAPLPEFDFHIPLLSLPHVLFSRHPAIPCPTRYLTVSPEKIALWSEKLPSPKLKIGLCWSGNPQHLNDRNRSIRLEQLEPLLKMDCAFVSVQKDIPRDDQAFLSAHPDIIDAGKLFGDFEDTAAALSNLDLMLSVDTSVAHLSGALGIPTWIMLPEPADWRWLRARSDSPWYPSVRLFRQTTRKDWRPVIEEIERALVKLQP